MRHNIGLDRFRLLNRRQEEDESFDEFHTSLQELADKAELRQMSHDDWIAVLIMAGTSDNKARQELLSKVGLPTLEETINLCRNEDKGRRGVRESKGSDGVSIAGIRGKIPYQRGKYAERRGNVDPRQGKGEDQARHERCRNCGFRHGEEGNCPARSESAKCHKCGKSGHFAPMCHLHQGAVTQEKSCNAIIIAGIGTSPTILVCAMSVLDRKIIVNISFIPDTRAQGTRGGCIPSRHGFIPIGV